MKNQKRILGIIISAFLVLMMIPLQSLASELPFMDISTEAWFYSDLKGAYEVGLIDGYNDKTFRPDETVTYAQAVKLATCINQKYTSGVIVLKNGSPNWYENYVIYAKDKGIICKSYNWNDSVTRADFVEIIANALPDEALQMKNSIAEGYIPDVGITHPQGMAIYKLYRAGILIGIDEIGTFQPYSSILRSEVCAILTRMMDESARIELTLGPAADDKMLNILLNRSDLEGLGEIKEPIYVTGHKNPDTDTVGSSIAYAALLQKLGYDAIPVVLGEINHETEFILDAAWMEIPELLEDASGKNIILVDHSEYAQSAEGLQDAHIIGIIDHHGDGSVTTANPLIYDARPLGSTATIIWMRYRNYGVEPDKQSAFVMMGAILSDTTYLQSKTTTFADREAVKALSNILGFSDINSFYQEMYRASISYEGMTDEEIFLSDYKEYESSDIKYSIGCINVYDEEGAKEMANRMKKTISWVLSSTDVDMTFAQISIFHDDISITYLVPSDQAASELIQSVFQDTAVFDGTAYRLEPGISRRQVLVPAITDYLKDHPFK